MADHTARFPGVTNDPETHVLTKRQAKRLAPLTSVPVTELAGRRLSEVIPRLRPRLDPRLLFSRRLCGRVVKPQPNGEPLPVPFATVRVYDTDLRLLTWSPQGSDLSWFFPFSIKRELIATVTTDECGRFCVWIPRFDLDHYLRWRLERRCYLEWLRKPTLVDVLREREVIPRPPLLGPLDFNEHVLTHAARVVGPPALSRLRALGAARVGTLRPTIDATLSRPAFDAKVRPPMSPSVLEALQPEQRTQLAARVGLPAHALTGLDPKRYFGPFLRCRDVFVPQWSTVLDVPDLTFEVLQDVDGDGKLEVIYGEGLFDVRWDAGPIGEIVLEADPIAIAGPDCNIPDIGVCGTPAILFAGNYPLQVPGATPDPAASPPIHDATSGYALRPNRPDENGIPNEGNRVLPAKTPFTGKFYLVGCTERPGAGYYRVHHKVNEGPTTFLRTSFGPLTKQVGTTLHTRQVSPIDGQWYPIIPRDEGWTPYGIIAPVDEVGHHLHTFRLEFGQDVSGSIQPIDGKTDEVAIRIDTTAPEIDVLELCARQPGVDTKWGAPLPITQCAVVARNGARPVQFRLRVSLSAHHLRDFSVVASGCGMADPMLIAGGLLVPDSGGDGLPAPDPSLAGHLDAHWHTSGSDDVATRELYYELPASAPAGCYHFTVKVNSRAFNPTEAVNGPDAETMWTIDRSPIYLLRVVSIALE